MKLLGLSLLIGASALSLSVLPLVAAEPDPAAILETYADIALAGYEDALVAARALDKAADALIADPSDETLTGAREAWRAARPAFLETAVFRFGNPIVDVWQGRVDGWQLDEGLIDYVDASYGEEREGNPLYAANVIANTTLVLDGAEVDARDLTPAFLADTLHKAGGVEANVATGYHAIEFLLWGQDLNGNSAGAGKRPLTDYSEDEHAARRGQYLGAATDLLVADLEEMVANWRGDGAARLSLEERGLAAILTGMGALSTGELAGSKELALPSGEPDLEHDAFSDNTHISLLHEAIGVRNVYLGRYERTNGRVVDGPSLSEMVAARDPSLDTDMRGMIDDSIARLEVLADRARGGEAFDQMIGQGNAAGNAIVQSAIDGLVVQTGGIERVAELLGIDGVTLEGGDSR